MPRALTGPMNMPLPAADFAARQFQVKQAWYATAGVSERYRSVTQSSTVDTSGQSICGVAACGTQHVQGRYLHQRSERQQAVPRPDGSLPIALPSMAAVNPGPLTAAAWGGPKVRSGGGM